MVPLEVVVDVVEGVIARRGEVEDLGVGEVAVLEGAVVAEDVRLAEVVRRMPVPPR